VRRVAVFVALFLSIALPARAQVQERKLIDRILKPDLSLNNSMQAKQFTVRGNTETKQARTKWFFLRKRSPEKQFADVRSYDAKPFAARDQRFSTAEANLRTRGRIPNVGTPYPVPGYTGVKSAPEREKAVDSFAFAESSRPFLVRGKSQKALSQQDTPMTIDQVRELLNKNK
jgi:hypothetical protein